MQPSHRWLENNLSMKSQRYKKEIPESTHQAISHAMDILDRLNELLLRKFEGKQKLLAEKMGKSEAEVSKWFSGVQNYTIKTLSKLEEAFGEKIISTLSDSDSTNCELVKSHYNESIKSIRVEPKGKLSQVEFKNFGIAHTQNEPTKDKLVPHGSEQNV